MLISMAEYVEFLERTLSTICKPGYSLTPYDCYRLLELTRPDVSLGQQKIVYEEVAESYPIIKELMPIDFSEKNPYTIVRGPLEVSLLEFDDERWRGNIEMYGKKLDLTPVEFELLRFLILNGNRVFSAKKLLQEVWGYPPGSGSNSLVSIYIGRLRTEIKRDPPNPEFLFNKRLYGYCFIIGDDSSGYDKLIRNSLISISEGSLTSDDFHIIYRLARPYVPLQRVLRIYDEVVEFKPDMSTPIDLSEIDPHTTIRGPLAMDDETFEVVMDEKQIYLTPVEFGLLWFLALNDDKVFSAEKLLQEVWGYPLGSGSDDLVRVHIRKLRKKIEPNPLNPIHVVNVPRRGYTLNP